MFLQSVSAFLVAISVFFTSAFIGTPADSLGYGTFHACSPETHADYYIDFVLCSEDIEVSAYRTLTAGIDGRFVSDHFPIYADVLIPGSVSD